MRFCFSYDQETLQILLWFCLLDWNVITLSTNMHLDPWKYGGSTDYVLRQFSAYPTVSLSILCCQKYLGQIMSNRTDQFSVLSNTFKVTIDLPSRLLWKRTRKCNPGNPSYQINHINQSYSVVSKLPVRVSFYSRLTVIIFICKFSRQPTEVRRGQIVGLLDCIRLYRCSICLLLQFRFKSVLKSAE